MIYCLYYQAHVNKPQTWFFVAILRSYEHICFDRTLDKSQSVFEFYVPKDFEQEFLSLMDIFLKTGVISNLIKSENRVLLGQDL